MADLSTIDEELYDISCILGIFDQEVEEILVRIDSVERVDVESELTERFEKDILRYVRGKIFELAKDKVIKSLANNSPIGILDNDNILDQTVQSQLLGSCVAQWEPVNRRAKHKLTNDAIQFLLFVLGQCDKFPTKLVKLASLDRGDLAGVDDTDLVNQFNNDLATSNGPVEFELVYTDEDKERHIITFPAPTATSGSTLVSDDVQIPSAKTPNQKEGAVEQLQPNPDAVCPVEEDGRDSQSVSQSDTSSEDSDSDSDSECDSEPETPTRHSTKDRTSDAERRENSVSRPDELLDVQVPINDLTASAPPSGRTEFPAIHDLSDKSVTSHPNTAPPVCSGPNQQLLTCGNDPSIHENCVAIDYSIKQPDSNTEGDRSTPVLADKSCISSVPPVKPPLVDNRTIPSTSTTGDTRSGHQSTPNTSCSSPIGAITGCRGICGNCGAAVLLWECSSDATHNRKRDSRTIGTSTADLLNHSDMLHVTGENEKPVSRAEFEAYVDYSERIIQESANKIDEIMGWKASVQAKVNKVEATVKRCDTLNQKQRREIWEKLEAVKLTGNLDTNAHRQNAGPSSSYTRGRPGPGAPDARTRNIDPPCESIWDISEEPTTQRSSNSPNVSKQQNKGNPHGGRAAPTNSRTPAPQGHVQPPRSYTSTPKVNAPRHGTDSDMRRAANEKRDNPRATQNNGYRHTRGVVFFTPNPTLAANQPPYASSTVNPRANPPVSTQAEGAVGGCDGSSSRRLGDAQNEPIDLTSGNIDMSGMSSSWYDDSPSDDDGQSGKTAQSRKPGPNTGLSNNHVNTTLGTGPSMISDNHGANANRPNNGARPKVYPDTTAPIDNRSRNAAPTTKGARPKTYADPVAPIDNHSRDAVSTSNDARPKSYAGMAASATPHGNQQLNNNRRQRNQQTTRNPNPGEYGGVGRASGPRAEDSSSPEYKQRKIVTRSGWRTPGENNKRKRERSGGKPVPFLKAATNATRVEIYVQGLDYSQCECHADLEDIVFAHCKRQGVTVIDVCTIPKAKSRVEAGCKVTIRIEDYDELMCPEFWPEGCTVREWEHRPRNGKQDGEPGPDDA